MRRRRRGLAAAAAAVGSWLLAVPLLGALPLTSSAARADEIRRGDFEDDLFVAGRWVDVQATVGGDLFAAGGWVDVEATVANDLTVAGVSSNITARTAGDLFWAGGMADIEGTVGDNLLVAGAVVTVDAEVDGKAIAAGGRVRLGRGALVRGEAWLAGGSVEVAGRVGGKVTATGGRVAVTGTIDGDLEVVGGRLEVGPGAKIGGAITAYGPQPPFIAEGAEIGGEVTHVPDQPADAAAPAEAIEDEGGRGVGTVLFLLGLVAVGVAIDLALPGYARAAAGYVRAHPWRSLGLGVALLTATPVVALLLVVTVVGIPLGVAAAFGYLALLLLGWVIAAFSLGGAVPGRWLPAAARRGRGRVLLDALAVLLLGLVALLPVVGGVLALVALLFGMGAAAAQAYQVWTRPSVEAEFPAAPG